MIDMQFESYEDAKAYLHEHGQLTYFGCEGYSSDWYYVVNWVRNGLSRVHHLAMYQDGRVREFK